MRGGPPSVRKEAPPVGIRLFPQHPSSCSIQAYFSLAQDNLDASPSLFHNPICSFSSWPVLCAPPSTVSPLLLVSIKCIPVWYLLGILSCPLIDLPPLCTNGCYYFWITCFGLCIITKYFKGACLVSQTGSAALQEVKARSYSKQLLNKYFISNEGSDGCEGSEAEAPGNDLLWDTKKRSRGSPGASGGSEAPSPGWMPGGLMPLTLLSDDWELL